MIEKIYIDRLKGGKTLEIDQVLQPSFLDVNEAELSFKKEITLKAKAYLSGDHLVLQCTMTAEANMPCTICTEWTALEVKLKNACLTVSLEEIKGSIFDPSDLFREALLAEVPMLAECAGGCSKRQELKPFLKEEEDEAYFPFNDL